MIQDYNKFPPRGVRGVARRGGGACMKQRLFLPFSGGRVSSRAVACIRSFWRARLCRAVAHTKAPADKFYCLNPDLILVSMSFYLNPNPCHNRYLVPILFAILTRISGLGRPGNRTAGSRDSCPGWPARSCRDHTDSRRRYRCLCGRRASWIHTLCDFIFVRKLTPRIEMWIFIEKVTFQYVALRLVLNISAPNISASIDFYTLFHASFLCIFVVYLPALSN